MRLCKDCKHYQPPPRNWPEGTCTHPIAVNFETGEGAIPLRHARAVYCGEIPKYFEPIQR